jgi:hypothetical protein
LTGGFTNAIFSRDHFQAETILGGAGLHYPGAV